MRQICGILLCSTSFVAAIGWTASAWGVDESVGESPYRLHYSVEEENTIVYRMIVSPAAEPKPALKHRLWSRPHELKPGNAAMHYVRSFAENWLNGRWQSVLNQYGEAVEDWYGSDIPIEELPLEMMHDAAQEFDDVVEHAIRPASLCRDSDWGLELMDLRGPEAISFRLPDFQQSRSIARMLALRTRLAIVERRYDDAIDHLRMQYRLARDVGQEMLLICNLIGIAIDSIASDDATEIIAAPDSPNLYWALAEVPSPLVDCTESIRLEMTLGLRIFPPLLDAETTEHSAAEWARLFGEALKAYQTVANVEQFDDIDLGQPPFSGLIATGIAMAAYPDAKQRLLTAGMSVEEVDQMSVGQLLLIDTAREHRRVADAIEKWWYVSFAEADTRRYEIEEIWKHEDSPMNLGKITANLLLPAAQAARNAQERVVWKRKALQVIEAVRMHAAETGELPKKLSQIQVVPVPLNPVTKNPYQYSLNGKTAILELPHTDGIRSVAYRYEITLEED